jgi:type I restriction enzyme S subunit
MANSWTVERLDNLVEDILDRRGLTPTKLGSQFRSTGHRVISAKLIKNGQVDLSADEPRYVDEATYHKWMHTPLLPDDVILTSEAPLGETAYVKTQLEWCLGQRLFAIRTKKDRLHGRFLYYALRSNGVRHDLHSRATGTTAQGIRQSELRKVPIPTPPLSEQRAIAGILGALDDKIKLNRQMNETLEAMARAIFKSWFVDFDPVRAKAGGRDPGLPKYICDLFPDRLENSELGEIPAGWKVTSFAETVGIFGGGTPKTPVPEYWGGDIPWFSVVDAPRDADVFVIDTEKKITQAGVDNSSARILPQGTSIISARGTVGRVALVGSPMAMNQSCYALRDSDSERGYYTYFATRNLVAILRQRVHGAVFDTITRDTLQGVSVVVPDRDLAEVFEAEVAPLLELILLNLRQSRTLAGIRDALLPKLISGELQVPDGQRLVDEVMP